MKFDESLRQAWTRDGDDWTFDIPEGWGQGRAVFGGVPAAIGAALARGVVPENRMLRTMSLQLLRPTSPGPVRGSCELLREGKSVSFVRVTLTQEAGVTMIANFTFTMPREEAMRVEAAPRFEGPAVETLLDAPYIPGFMPEFLQHLQMRWASGGAPFSASKEAHFTGYFRFRVPTGGAEGLLALLDVWPSPSLSLLKKPTPASTVTWTAHILELPSDFGGWFAFEYETVAGAHGMHTSLGRRHGPDGRLLGWTEQTVAVFA